MYNIYAFPDIIAFLKKLSPRYFKETGKEIVIFCPYCDDATRKNPTHGHFYLAVESPVFYCFRCNISGRIVRFLKDFDCEIPKALKEHVDFDNVQRLKAGFQPGTSVDDIRKFIEQENLRFLLKYPDLYKKYSDFLDRRIGQNSAEFLLTPGLLYGRSLAVFFYNGGAKLVTARLTAAKKYHRFARDEYYFFQPFNYIEEYQAATIAEGPFDIINLYCYTAFRTSFLLAILGKNYVSAFEWLVSRFCLIGKYRINIIFDNDVTKYKYIRLIRKSRLNPDLDIRFFEPLVGKDVGDFTEVREIKLLGEKRWSSTLLETH